MVAGAPATGHAGAPIWRSGPPKRLFGLANDVAPGQADIMQVAIGPARQFAPLARTLPPNMQGLAELAEKVGNMTICH